MSWIDDHFNELVEIFFLVVVPIIATLIISSLINLFIYGGQTTLEEFAVITALVYMFVMTSNLLIIGILS